MILALILVFILYGLIGGHLAADNKVEDIDEAIIWIFCWPLMIW